MSLSQLYKALLQSPDPLDGTVLRAAYDFTAKNPTLRTPLLQMLATRRDTPADILTYLTRSHESEVREAAVFNPTTPADAVRTRVLEETVVSVVSAWAQRVDNPVLLDALLVRLELASAPEVRGENARLPQAVFQLARRLLGRTDLTPALRSRLFAASVRIADFSGGGGVDLWDYLDDALRDSPDELRQLLGDFSCVRLDQLACNQLPLRPGDPLVETLIDRYLCMPGDHYKKGRVAAARMLKGAVTADQWDRIARHFGQLHTTAEQEARLHVCRTGTFDDVTRLLHPDGRWAGTFTDEEALAILARRDFTPTQAWEVATHAEDLDAAALLAARPFDFDFLSAYFHSRPRLWVQLTDNDLLVSTINEAASPSSADSGALARYVSTALIDQLGVRILDLQSSLAMRLLASSREATAHVSCFLAELATQPCLATTVDVVFETGPDRTLNEVLHASRGILAPMHG